MGSELAVRKMGGERARVEEWRRVAYWKKDGEEGRLSGRRMGEICWSSPVAFHVSRYGLTHHFQAVCRAMGGRLVGDVVRRRLEGRNGARNMERVEGK